jgi:hypothetical protein
MGKTFRNIYDSKELIISIIGGLVVAIVVTSNEVFMKHDMSYVPLYIILFVLFVLMLTRWSKLRTAADEIEHAKILHDNKVK